MKVLINLMIFCIILFIYLHIFFHTNTSNDLEIYEINNPSKDKLEEICDFKQPVQIIINEPFFENINFKQLNNNYNGFDIKIRNYNENIESNINNNNITYLPLNINISSNLFNKSNSENYFTEKNNDFLDETGVIKTLQQNDTLFRPSLLSDTNYDFLYGFHSHTPLRYNMSYRNYFMITQGNCTIKLIPPSFNKYLNIIKDYDNFEFRSPLNLWDIQQQYKSDFSKIKVLEVNLKENDIIFIPAYWFYTIKFDNCSIVNINYKTYMNNLSILPHLIKKIFQQMNVKNDFFKKVPNQHNQTSENNVSADINNENNNENNSTTDINNENISNLNN